MSVLSLRKSVDQLDQTAEQFAAYRRTISRCIRATAQYAVELKSEDTSAFRANLDRLAARAEGVPDPAEAERLQTTFREELHAYHELAESRIQRMRAEMAEVMQSMQAFMSSVSGSNHNHQQVLRQEFDSLDATAQSGDLSSIRSAIRHAAATAIRSCEQIQQEQELITAQLQDEIRHLHKEVAQERLAGLRDPSTGLWNRAKLDSRIKDLVLLNEGFCLFLIGLPDQIRISQNDPRIGAAVLQALAERLKSVSGKDGELGMPGRWSEEVFAIVFSLPLSGAPVEPRALQHALTGEYSVQVNENVHNVSVEVRVAAVERLKDSPENAFYLQLGRAAFQVIAH